MLFLIFDFRQEWGLQIWIRIIVVKNECNFEIRCKFVGSEWCGFVTEKMNVVSEQAGTPPRWVLLRITICLSTK